MVYVKLHPAFLWQCPVCHKANYVDAGIGELSEDDVRHLGVSYPVDFRFEGVPDWRNSDNEVCSESLVNRVAIGPAKVKCEACSQFYLTRIACDDEGDESSDEE